MSFQGLFLTGERKTEVTVKKKYNTTHSYTVQPLTLANGHLLNTLLPILQKEENTFGKRVQKGFNCTTKCCSQSFKIRKK